MGIPVWSFAAGLLVLIAGTYHFVTASAAQPPSVIPSQFIDVPMPDGTLQVAIHETTVGQWRACMRAGACALEVTGDMDDDLPMSGLNWADLTSYINWYRSETGLHVRLPSRAEWTILAADQSTDNAEKLFEDPRMAWAASYDMTRRAGDTQRQSVESFGANENGLFDIRGNVWEWTATCDPDIAEIDGNAAPCFAGRIAMGKHTAVLSDQLRNPGKAGCSVGQPPDHVGFRLVMDG